MDIMYVQGCQHVQFCCTIIRIDAKLYGSMGRGSFVRIENYKLYGSFFYLYPSKRYCFPKFGLFSQVISYERIITFVIVIEK